MRSYLKKTHHKKRAGRVAQDVDPSPSTGKKQKNKNLTVQRWVF
jgi:hypothetical protein